MTRLKPFGLLALVVLAGCASPSPDAGDPDAPELAAVHGVVVDAAIRPVEGAVVAVQGRGDTQTATTALDGTFTLDALAPGAVVLSVSKAGYLTAFVDALAGKASPAVQVVLEPLLESQPYTMLESFDGFIECGVGSGPVFGLAAGCMVVLGGALYVACTGSPPVPPTGVCLGATSPYAISQAEGNVTTAQTEAVWEPTVQGQAELFLGSYVVDRAGQVVSGAPGVAGNSILVRALNASVVQDLGLGREHQLATFVTPGNSGAANVVVQQPYRVFHTSSFFFELPEGWIFARDGPAPIPNGR